MDKIQIKGGNRLNGELKISGAKNAALPLMVASLLSDEPLTLTNVPHLTDISQLTEILCGLGVDLVMNGDGHAEAETGRVITLTARNITSTFAPYDLVRKMRASFLVIGPLLARCHQAQVSLPGGCAIGTRPVDLHLKGLEAMGAEIELIEGYVHAKAPGGLKGAHFHFPFVSVGATENLMMAASLAKGTTVLENAAQEPEITDLGLCLMAMGAKISVDSATLMNKGLELIEAAHLFALTHEQLGVVIHRQSLVHALIEFVDGSIHAQMGAADMRLPIAHVLAYPERLRWRAPKLNLAQIGSLTFEAPDLSRFPALALAQACLRQGGGYPTILNAANEVAVEAFLNGRLPFLGVAEVCERVLNGFPHMAQSDHLDLAAILALDLEARHAARSAIAQSSTPISHIH